jgi:uncharacterized protein YuzE
MKNSTQVTFDKEANTVYMYLMEIADGEIADTFTCEDLPQSVTGDINLDFDKHGKLRGIEILNASEILPKQYLDSL